MENQNKNVNNQNYHDRKVNFNAYKTTLSKDIIAAKKLYHTNLFVQHQNDFKKTWTIMSETLNKNKRSLILEIMLINNVGCSDKQKKLLMNSINDLPAAWR